MHGTTNIFILICGLFAAIDCGSLNVKLNDMMRVLKNRSLIRFILNVSGRSYSKVKQNGKILQTLNDFCIDYYDNTFKLFH